MRYFQLLTFTKLKITSDKIYKDVKVLIGQSDPQWPAEGRRGQEKNSRQRTRHTEKLGKLTELGSCVAAFCSTEQVHSDVLMKQYIPHSVQTTHPK